MSPNELDDLVRIIVGMLQPPEPPPQRPASSAPAVTLSAEHYFLLLKNIHDLEHQLACERHLAVMREEGPDWLRSRFELMGFFKVGGLEYAGPFDDPQSILQAAHYYVTAFLGQAMSPKPDEAAFLAKRFPENQPDPVLVHEPFELPEDPPAPNLTDFDLSHRDGRLGFLWALFMDHYRTGLLIAVNHVWSSLSRPRAERCQSMAAALKLPGTGKKALTNVLAAFLEETLYGVEFPPLPNRSDYPNTDVWTAACNEHWAGINHALDVIMDRYEALLDGRDPVVADNAPSRVPTSGVVLKGPWRETLPLSVARQ